MSSMGPDLPDGAGVLHLPDLGGAKIRERVLTPPLVAPDTPRPRAAGRFSGRCERDAQWVLHIRGVGDHPELYDPTSYGARC